MYGLTPFAMGLGWAALTALGFIMTADTRGAADALPRAVILPRLQRYNSAAGDGRT